MCLCECDCDILGQMVPVHDNIVRLRAWYRRRQKGDFDNKIKSKILPGNDYTFTRLNVTEGVTNDVSLDVQQKY